MSVTSGVVSRIEVTSYTHGATALLGMQIDAGENLDILPSLGDSFCSHEHDGVVVHLQGCTV